MDTFWQHTHEQIVALRTARTVDAVLAICPPQPGVACGHGFFGGGGDSEVLWSLRLAGWDEVWWESRYFWCARPPEGTGVLEYVEGDLYRRELAEER